MNALAGFTMKVSLSKMPWTLTWVWPRRVALDIGLIPAKAETSKGAAIQWRVLNQEQIKARIFGQPAGSQDHDIVLRTGDKPIADGSIRENSA